MDKLPKHIADLCGILEDGPRTYGKGQLDRTSGPDRTGPIATADRGDGSFTVSYFGREIGHMTRAKMPDRDAQHWIAVTTNGDVKRCFSQNHARSWIIENSF
jgi:hypothetical protein